MASTSSLLITAPVGLQGEFRMMAFVLGVMHFSTSAAVMLKPFSSWAGTGTALAPAIMA